MATPVIAAGAGALGFYLWLRQWQQCGYAGVRDLPLPLETHACTEAPPNTWLETIYLFKEAVRCVCSAVGSSSTCFLQARASLSPHASHVCYLLLLVLSFWQLLRMSTGQWMHGVMSAAAAACR